MKLLFLVTAIAVLIQGSLGQLPIGTCSEIIPGSCEGCCQTDECYNPEPQCIWCLERYYMQDEYTCLACPRFCAACKDSNGDGTTECTECDPYYYLSDGSCYPCLGHCEQCSEDFKCATDGCGEGYYLENGKVTCETCTAGCLSCEDSGSRSCFECRDSWYPTTYDRILGTGSCTKCGSRCNLCKDGTSCDECERGYHWTGFACEACIANCDVAGGFCLTNGGCSQCLFGYSLVTDLGSPYCLRCYDCDNGDEGLGSGCDITGGCTACDLGYTLDEKYHTCNACPEIDGNSRCEASCGTSTRGRFLDADDFCNYCPPFSL